MLNHGVSTGGLFMIVGMLSDRRHTRLISEFGGLKAVMPRLVAAFLLDHAVVDRAARHERVRRRVPDPARRVPVGPDASPSFAATGVILSAVYMLWMFQRVNYGPVTNAKNRALPDLTPREWALVVPTIAMAIVMGVLPGAVPAADGAGGRRASIERVTGRSRRCATSSRLQPAPNAAASAVNRRRSRHARLRSPQRQPTQPESPIAGVRPDD